MGVKALAAREQTPPRMLAASLSRQQARTDATRAKLLKAAEQVFARSGFEAARLEDIAAAAGYTRGAFYANFESKEDLFMALLEECVRRRVADVRELMARAGSPQAQAKAFREYYAEIATQKQWALIFLEYKLFAVRHPEARARLQRRIRNLRAAGIEILKKLSAALGRPLPVSASVAAVGMGALSNALLLEHLVDPESISGQDIHTLLGLFLDLLTAAG
jgi:AcrR family transcriptional regulator